MRKGFLSITLLLALHATLSCLEQSSLESQLISHVSEILSSFPTALLPIIAQYAVTTPLQPVMMINTEDSSYYPIQRHVTKDRILSIWVVGKNPKNPKLPLGLTVNISPETIHKHPINSHVSSWYPAEWYPKQFISDLTKLYKERYPHEKGPLRITKGYTNSSVSHHAPYITNDTAAMFSHLSKHKIMSVSPTSPEAEGGKKLTTIFIAPGHSFRSPFQLLKNLYLHLTPLCSQLPKGKFPEGDIINWDKNASHLNNIVKRYRKQKKAIAAIISQPLQTSLVPFLWKGESQSAAIDFARLIRS